MHGHQQQLSRWTEIQVFGFILVSQCTWIVYFKWYKWWSSSCCQSSIMLYVPQRDRRIVLCLRTLKCIPIRDYFLLAPWHATQTLFWFQTTICFRVFLLVWHFVGSSALPSIPNNQPFWNVGFRAGQSWTNFEQQGFWISTNLHRLEAGSRTPGCCRCSGWPWEGECSLGGMHTEPWSLGQWRNTAPLHAWLSQGGHSPDLQCAQSIIMTYHINKQTVSNESGLLNN